MVTHKFKNKKALAVIGLIIGILLIALSISLSKGPAHSESNATPLALTVIEVQPMPFVITAKGFGITRPEIGRACVGKECRARWPLSQYRTNIGWTVVW